MTRKTQAWRVVAAAAATALVLAACGSDDGDSDEAASEDTTASGDGTLVIGTLLPETGSLSFLGPPEFAGVDLAEKEINDAGGVLGQDVEVIDQDSGDTSSNIAQQAVDSLISQDADAIIGAASSSVTLSVIDKVVNAEIAMISPANTSLELSDYPDDGFYFRTAPADVIQGPAMGDLILNDGNASVAIIALQDAYGETLAAQIQETVEAGNGTVEDIVFYDPKAKGFSSEVSEIKATNADAVVVVGFDETASVIQEAVKQNFGPQEVQYYFVDGNLKWWDTQFDKGTLDGVKGTTPGDALDPDFVAALEDAYGEKLNDKVYAGEAYDATILAALAAEAAGDDSGASIASQLQAVSRDGTKCTSFEECRDLIAEGEDIDYDGVSGPVEFDDNGNPSAAFIGIYEYNEDNTYEGVDSIFREL